MGEVQNNVWGGTREHEQARETEFHLEALGQQCEQQKGQARKQHLNARSRACDRVQEGTVESVVHTVRAQVCVLREVAVVVTVG